MRIIMADGELSLPVSKTFVLAVLFGGIFQVSSVQPFQEPEVVEEVVLWKRGDRGVSDYRIPIITALVDGSLLALSEGRKHSSSDSGPKFLALRHSRDQGSTWSDTTFIEDDKEASDGLNLGCILVDKETESVFVMYSFCFHKCTYHTTYLIRSDNNGMNWTLPQNISQQIGSFAFAPGPGFGIQKNMDPWKNRLIICGHSSKQHEGMYCVVSDDHGTTWNVAGTLPREGQFDPNECQLVEQDDGIILLTARNEQNEECHCRIMAQSYDGAETFAHSNTYIDKTLIDPTVAASLLNYKSVIYFSNPANRELRVNMTVRWSGDQGETWKGSLGVWKGPSGYSCLSAIPTNQGNNTYIGLVFEKGNILYYESIVFVKIKV